MYPEIWKEASVAVAEGGRGLSLHPVGEQRAFLVWSFGSWGTSLHYFLFSEMRLRYKN